MNEFMIALHFNDMVRSYVNSIGGRLKFANLILFLLPPVVCDDHGFKDEKLFYRFRRDDGTYAGPLDAPLVAKAQRIYSRYELFA